MATDDLAQQVAAVPFWYHTLQLAPGVVTPGEFDLRDSVDALPWPEVRGTRCLDVATFDGFYAFELERRGAAEVVAIDLDDAADLDWLPRQVPAGFARGQQPIGVGFRVAAEARGSQVRRVSCSVYDLDPDELGTFDVVVCGALLQHLRDPHLALQAMRRVCRGALLSVELVDETTSLLLPRRPVRVLRGGNSTWAVGNVAAHAHLLDMAGWDVVDRRRLGMARGPAGRAVDARSGTPRWKRTVTRLARRALASTTDPVFSAIVARPNPVLHPLPAGTP